MTPTVTIPIDLAREALRSFGREIGDAYAEVGNEDSDDLRSDVPDFKKRMVVRDLMRALKNIDAINAAIRAVDPLHGNAEDVVDTWARTVVEQHGQEVAA